MSYKLDTVFPGHPATMEIYTEEGIFIELLKEFSWGPSEGNGYPFYGMRNDGYNMREVDINEILNDLPGFFEFKTVEGTRIVVRKYEPYDSLLGKVSGVPWPRLVMQDWLQGDGEVTMEALVDTNGDVATLLLTSPSAMYLRFSSQWILLSDLDTISEYNVVEVEDTALDIFDPLEQTGRSVKITSMPVKAVDDFRVAVGYSDTPEAKKLAPMLSAAGVTASGLDVPIISSAADLPGAIDFASDHPEFQWYVERRSKALGLAYEFPWE